MTEFEAVIGLEIHVQLATQTKMFCGCKPVFGEDPNTRTCPTCLGLPGALPVINESAVDFGMRLGLALGCSLAERSIFHRKNYFYADSPKGYQISQYDEPLCSEGELAGVRINRVHLEDDAAKLVHTSETGRIHGAESSVVDFNRAGTPLAEIVTEPDLRSAAQAREWLQLLRTTVKALNISDVNMEEGSLRCDANISVRPVGQKELATKTELKNMNSFRFVEKGIEAEIERQRVLLESGGTVVQETLHFDPRTGSLTALRSKEEAHDYRYFPDPDLLPVSLDSEMVERAQAALPELPAARAVRYAETYGFEQELSERLGFEADLGDLFEAVVEIRGQASDPRLAATWVSGEVFSRVEEDAGSAIEASTLAELLELLEGERITTAAARQVLDRVLAEGGSPAEIVASEGLEKVGGGDALAAAVELAISAHPEAAAKVAAGEHKALGPLVGVVMKETQGRADGGEVRNAILARLGGV